MRERVDALAGPEPVPRYHGTIVESPQGYRLELTVEGAEVHVERELVDADCEALAEAAALAIVSLVGGEPEPSPDPVAIDATPSPRGDRREQALPSREAPRPARARETPERPRWTFPRPRAVFGRVGVGLDVGSVALAGVVPELGLGIEWDRFRGVLSALGALRQPILEGGAVTNLSLGAAKIDGCYLWSHRDLSFPLCLGFEAGAVRAVPRDFDRARTRVLPWVAPSLAAGVVWRLHPVVRLFGQARVLAPVVRPQVVFTDSAGETRELHRAAPVSGRFLVGLEMAFWRDE